jgi:hypothetical protein
MRTAYDSVTSGYHFDRDAGLRSLVRGCRSRQRAPRRIAGFGRNFVTAITATGGPGAPTLTPERLGVEADTANA